MENKPRALVSACLLGVTCRYDGGSKICPQLDALMERFELIPVCPEQLGGLPTPRLPSERRGESVVARDGTDVTAAFQRGAEQSCKIAALYGARCALLKARSPSCGSGEIYDGSFSGKLTPGFGVAAEALHSRGIDVYDEESIDAMLATLEDAKA